MTIIAASRRRKVQLLRQFSTGHGGARPDTEPEPQPDPSLSFKVGPLGRNKPPIQRNDREPCAGSARYLADDSSAAVKSP